MPKYRYIALKSNGSKVENIVQADSNDDVVKIIRENGLYPVKIEIVNEKGLGGSKVSFGGKVKIKEVAVFCRQFHTMLNAGVSVVNCLDILREQTQNKKLKSAISSVYENVQKGNSLSESMGKHKKVFPELLVFMIEAGEISGNLDSILDRMAIHYSKEYKIENKVKKAMTYPMFLSIISIFVVIFMLAVVFPSIVSMFIDSGTALPLPTLIVMTLSEIILKYWYIFLLGTSLILYITKAYHSTAHGRLKRDKKKLRNPLLKKMNTNIITSRFTRTLSTLMKSGVPLMQALEVVAKVVGNKYVEDGLKNIKDDLKKGAQLSQPIKALKIFPPMVVSMISIGEESGALDEILDKTADFYDEEVETSIQQMTSILEPIMIVVLAIVIGFIVVAMMLPILTMINTLDF